MPKVDWLVVGIAGATCSGKSTVANQLEQLLPTSKLVKQDDYFLDVKDERHTMISELNHINFEIMSSLNMDGMHRHIEALLEEYPVLPNKNIFAEMKGRIEKLENHSHILITDSSQPVHIPPVLIIEGFLVLNDNVLSKHCDLKFYFTLDKDTCWNRRKVRVYEPPDPPGYFDMCVWPWYETHFNEICQNDVSDIHFVDGSNSPTSNLHFVLTTVLSKLNLTTSNLNENEV